MGRAKGMPDLYWLPLPRAWPEQLRELSESVEPVWSDAVALANLRLDFLKTNALDAVAQRRFGGATLSGQRHVRLALLGSSTMSHLHGAIRVAGLRRGIWIDIYENPFGQYWNELCDSGSSLRRFKPDTVLFAFDAENIASAMDDARSKPNPGAALADIAERFRACWRVAREDLRCRVIHQTAIPQHVCLIGNNEHRLPGSPADFVSRLNAALPSMADDAGIDLLSLDRRVSYDGLDAWHNPVLWRHAKQAVSPAAAPFYGDLVVRLLAARMGRSSKCLVLDLDNTIWGGEVGEVGVEGLTLGQGSALGEAYSAFQKYVRALSRRGIVLAACSKNDEAKALDPFDRHPDMVLRRDDFAVFIANWADKSANLLAIASELNIGVDSLVFVDDSSFERALIRHAAPAIAVPELPEDPVAYPRTLADAGYFEAVTVTMEDIGRSSAYRQNRERQAAHANSESLDAYLRGLEMELVWSRLDRMGLQRAVQIVNKTNQFNLTGRRYNESEMAALMVDDRVLALQFRLLDRFGDNGTIAIVIGRIEEGSCLLDTWLMSCRVFGRRVEHATLNIVAELARGQGAHRLIGEYIPSDRNVIVADHYDRLGFRRVADSGEATTRSVLNLSGFKPLNSPMAARQA
jgi:FkbH-like protein